MEHHGHIEPMTRRSKANAARVQLIIHALSDRFTGDPFPAMSEHYRVPGAIGSVLLPHEYTAEEFELPYQPSPMVIEDTRTGMDSNGNWHCTSRISPEQAEALLKVDMNRWDDMGTY